MSEQEGLRPYSITIVTRFITDDEKKNTVSIIGVGLSGLVTAKVLQRDGFVVTIYDKEPTIVGVWTPSRAYAELSAQNPQKAYAFSDGRSIANHLRQS